MKTLNIIAIVLLMIGGLNWGSVGLFQVDVVAMLFGADTTVSNVIYTLVGVAAIYSISLFKPVLKNENYREAQHAHTPHYGAR